MLILWTTCAFVAAVNCHEVPEVTQNVTALYPVLTTGHTTERSTQAPQTTEQPNKSPNPGPFGTTSWKIDTAFVQPKPEIPNNTNPQVDVPDKRTDFRPSPHLGDFFELDSVEEPSKDIRSHVNNPWFNSKSPAEIFNSVHKKYPVSNFPYKFDRAALGRQGEPASGLGRYAAPEELPAGALYPVLEEELPHDLDHALMRREHELAWRKMTRLLTALLPVGLLVSALTPGVLNVSPNSIPFGQRLRRAVKSTSRGELLPAELVAATPPLGERCRRRMLCELMADSGLSDKSGLGVLSASCAHEGCQRAPTSLAPLLAALRAAGARRTAQEHQPEPFYIDNFESKRKF